MKDCWEMQKCLQFNFKSIYTLQIFLNQLFNLCFEQIVRLLISTGFVVGQAGLYQSITMFLVAYFIITMTVLSICAISTNGALEAGGAYCILFITQS